MPALKLLLIMSLLALASNAFAESSCSANTTNPTHTADAATTWPNTPTPSPWPAPQAGTDWAGANLSGPGLANAVRPMSIFTMPVGSGNCQMMLCPSQNRMIMFDCGSTGAGALGWNRADVQGFLATQINDATDIVVSISHPDADHSNFLPDVLAGRAIRAVLVSRHPNDYPAPVVAWMANLQQAGTVIRWWNGLYSSQFPEPYLSCYAPNSQGGWNIDVPGFIVTMNAGATANDSSMVIAQQYGPFQSVFTGDMTGATEMQINPNAPVALAGTTVITGAHHGAISHGSNDPQWTQANSADLVMFSSGTRFHHPRCAAVGNYFPYLAQNAAQHGFECGDNGQWVGYQTQRAVYVTNNNGLIRVRADGQGGWDYVAAQNALDYLNVLELQGLDRMTLPSGPEAEPCGSTEPATTP